MVTCDTEVTARPGAECFDRPLQDGHLFLYHFPAPRTGLLSVSPSLLRPSGLRRTSRDESSAHRQTAFCKSSPPLLKSLNYARLVSVAAMRGLVWTFNRHT